ncbi:MAG: ketopantoate reductase family protein [Burkholderiales bacterium]
MSKDLSIAVIGGGAIGGITAAYLTISGYDVELVCKHEEKARQAAEEGLHIVGVRGERRVKVKAVAETGQLSGKKDIVLIAVKAYDMPDAAKSALPFLKDDSLVVSMQNGICVEALAAVVGEKRAVGCMIDWGAAMLPDGTLNLKSEGFFVIGSLDPQVDVSPVKEALDSVMPTNITGSIIAELYSKMIINSCITSTGVLTGQCLGDILKTRAGRDMFISIIREAIAVADAMGLAVKPYGGKIDYYSLIKGNGLLARVKRDIIVRVIGHKHRTFISSSLQALKRGKPTEVDYFNGYIARKGDEYGVPAPVNRRIVQMIKEIEEGKRNIEPANLLDSGLKSPIK